MTGRAGRAFVGIKGLPGGGPEDDFSVLDADSSQRSAIDAVLAGRSLVIHGPPGTGKSQTIANMIAALVARGRKVLFVAEKRAAIDAVLSRLKGVGLADIVLDIHEGTRDRLRIARDLGDALDGALQAAQPEVGDLHRRLRDRQRAAEPARGRAAPRARAVGGHARSRCSRRCWASTSGPGPWSGWPCPSASTAGWPTRSATSCASSRTWAGS